MILIHHTFNLNTDKSFVIPKSTSYYDVNFSAQKISIFHKNITLKKIVSNVNERKLD